MERSRRAVAASFFIEGAFASGSSVTLPEAAAHHARVKRLAIGNAVHLTDGAGRVASAELTSLDKRGVVVDVGEIEERAPPPPIHLRVPVGDRDRMLWLAEKATELGAASWQAVKFRRSSSVSPRGEGEAFAAKVRARMISALEQSGGAWLPKLLPDVGLGAVAIEAGQTALLLDPRGTPLTTLLSDPTVEPVLLFGPEGGIEADEMVALSKAGWRRARLADTILRFETAGLAALAVCRAHLFRET